MKKGITSDYTLLLREDLRFHFEGTNLILKNHSGDSVLLEDIPFQILSELKYLLENPKIPVSKNNKLYPILDFLHTNKMAAREPVSYEKWQARTAHWIANLDFDYDSVKVKLENSKVAILGLGGLGSVACQQLAQSGVKKIALIDYSRVNEEDLNRQLLYQRSDIGLKKTTAAYNYLKENYSEISVDIIERTLLGSEADLRSEEHT